MDYSQVQIIIVAPFVFFWKLSCHDVAMVLASKLCIESVKYSHIQEEFTYWLEYFKSRRKCMGKKNTKEDMEILQGYCMFALIYTKQANMFEVFSSTNDQ